MSQVPAEQSTLPGRIVLSLAAMLFALLGYGLALEGSFAWLGSAVNMLQLLKLVVFLTPLALLMAVVFRNNRYAMVISSQVLCGLIFILLEIS